MQAPLLNELNFLTGYVQTTVEEVINELYRLDCYGKDRVVDAYFLT